MCMVSGSADGHHLQPRDNRLVDEVIIMSFHYVFVIPLGALTLPSFHDSKQNGQYWHEETSVS